MICVERKPLKIELDDDREVATIEGTKYSYQFFRDLGRMGLAVGSTFQVVERSNGDIAIRQVPGPRWES